MSQIGDSATLLLDTIKADVEAAYGTDMHTVMFADPELTQNDPGYTTIDLVEIAEDLSAGGGDQVEITYEVEITEVWPRPKEGDPVQNVTLFKIVKMDLLAKRLMPGPNYANFFYLPTIPSRKLRELDSKQNDRVQFVMSFVCKCTIDHH